MSTPEAEPGPYPDRARLVARVLAGPLPEDLWCYFTLRQLTDQAVDDREATIDELDRRLALALEEPTLWGVLAAWRAAAVAELPTADEARQAAARLLPGASPGQVLQLVMAGVVAPDDPGLGDLMGYMAAAAGRCLANSWTLAPAAPTVVSDLVSGLLWLSVSGKLGEGMAETLAAEEARLWQEMEQHPDPERLAWLLLAGA